MARSKNSPVKSPALFPLGTAYYPDHWPDADWAADLDRIRDAGVSYVRFGEFSWSWFQPSEKHYEWAGYDRFVDLCGKRNLKVVLCTPTATLPPWLLHKHPDCRLLNDRGEPCYSPRHFWAWRHHASQRLAADTIVKLAERYGKHPAVTAWQIDNEPNLAEDTRQVYDFNPATLGAFRQWLRHKYGGSLDALNAAWYSNFWSQRYSDWEQIGVTHMPHRCNPGYWLDFARFREHNLGEMVRWQAKLLRAHTSNQLIGTNIPETGAHLSAPIAQDYFDQALTLDWIGTDLYAATGKREADLQWLAYSVDLIRSAGEAAGVKEFILAETQGGPHRRTWRQNFAGEAWGPDYLKQSSETYITHGASKVFYFLWRPTPGGHELGMNGVQHQDGSNTPRTQVVHDLAHNPAGLDKLRATHLKRPRAVIHYSRDTIRFQQHFHDLQPIEHALRGAHRLLEAVGYRVDFINDDGLAAWKPDGKTPLLLPRSELVSQAAADKLAAHVKSGAFLLAGPHTGMLDEHGQFYAHPPAAEVFGCIQNELVDTEKLGKTKDGRLPVASFRRLAPKGGKILRKLANGFPAAVKNKTATLLAWPLFEYCYDCKTSELKAIAKALGVPAA